MKIQGKTALVTGSTKGVGAEIAISLATKGADIILNARHRNKSMEEKIESYGVKCHFIPADVASSEEVDELIDKLISENITPDILINNAGINLDKLFMNMTEEEFYKVINVNLMGTFRVTQPIFKKMLKNKNGVIINISSIVGEHGNIGQANYAASKAGIIGMTKVIAREGACRSVRCNAIIPGMIDSLMTRKLSEKNKKQILNQIPLGYIGYPNYVAQAVNYAIENDYVTGQTLVVDGGMSI